MPLRTLLITLLVAVALAGCGRRGPLEEPGKTAAPPPASAANSIPGGGISPLDPGSSADDAITPPAEAPQKRFFLDFLL